MTQGQLFPTPSEAPGGPYKGTNDGRPYTGAREPSEEPEYVRPIVGGINNRWAVLDRRDEIAHKHSLISSQQFMPITKLMDTESGDFAPDSVGHVHEHIYSDRKERAEGFGHYNWGKLHKDVAREGITQPLWVHPWAGNSPGAPYPALMNGHHRAMVAIDQGHLFVPTSDDYNGHDHPGYRPQGGYKPGESS